MGRNTTTFQAKGNNRTSKKTHKQRIRITPLTLAGLFPSRTFCGKISTNYVQKEIKKFVETKNFIAKKVLAHNQMLNLDVDGRPMSAIMLAISRGRSTELDRIGFDDIKSTTSDFIKNLDMSFNVWKDEKAFGKIHPLASLSYEEERIISFLHNNGPHSIMNIATALNMNLEDCRKVVRILHEVKFVLYSFDSEKYDVVDQ